MNPRLNICLHLYRRLASAYPHEFRMRYGADLDRLGEDAVPQVWRQYGVPGVVRLLADIAAQLPAMYLVEIRQDLITQDPGQQKWGALFARLLPQVYEDLLAAESRRPA